jgi:glycosyltransferase involved in cell wall biosynthesis
MMAISLLTLVPGVSGGSETYATELIRALARVGRFDYRVYAPAIAPEVIDGLAGRTLASYPASTSKAGRLRAMALSTAFPQRLRGEFKADGVSGVHFPVTIPIPRGTGAPTVTTLLDLQHELHPRFFSRAERLYRRFMYRAAVRESLLVITISEHVGETLIERLDVEPDRLRVIYLGVDLDRLRPTKGQRAPFLLYPANGWPHKNHARLLKAFELVRRERPELRLVLTGSGLEGLPRASGVDVRGHVSRDELVRLYQTAHALVFPSLYEGFGLPPLEAMACGCPVACSSSGALPEVCADAVKYFDPREPEAMASAVLDVLEDAGALVERGLARAARFTWAECAHRHDDVYEELLAC